MATTDLPSPAVRGARADQPDGLVPESVRLVLDWGARYHVSVLNVGLACCAVEFVAATMNRPDVFRADDPRSPGAAPDAHVMVVSGTVTDAMAPAVLRLYERLPESRYVVSFGACSNSGGPYWDSYCVTKGVDQLIPVDLYVPGCPPRPEALVDGLERLRAAAAR